MNGNKRINNLKRLVIIISIAILIVAVILIMSIYNNKFGKIGGSSEGGMSTVPTTTSTDIILDPDGDETTTTTNATPAGDDETTTTSVTSSSKVTKSNTKTQAPSGGSQTITEPPAKYTVITSGGSGYPNSVSSLEWATFDEVNKKRGNKLQMSQELRAKAQEAANAAVNSLIDSEKNDDCGNLNPTACRCDYGSMKFDGSAFCANYNSSVANVTNSLIQKNGGILDDDFKYIGVGVVMKDDHYSYVIIVD